MKRSQAFPSRYLAQADVAAPIIATIADVIKEEIRCDHGLEEKTVMTFAEPNIKPLIMNNVNWCSCENAYGEDSDDWRGQPIEIYGDPTVMFGRERVGGVRVRLPAKLVVPTPGKTPTAPTQRPAARPQQPLTIEQKHQMVLNGFQKALDEAKVKEWAEWANKQNFALVHVEEQMDAYYAALDRLGVGDGQRAEMAGAGEEIPF
jgi:hypothetical protein